MFFCRLFDTFPVHDVSCCVLCISPQSAPIHIHANMSSWCCSTCPYPNPLPPYSTLVGKNIQYPRVTAAPYAMYAKKLNDNTAKWYAPVFLQDPGPCVTSIQSTTFHLCDSTNTTFTVYANNELSGSATQPAGYPILSPRSCMLRVCTSSRDQIQRDREENIRINVQNGTWCKTPMTSSEFLEYSKAMDGVRNVYVATSDCC